jgi:hypothetical protein
MLARPAGRVLTKLKAPPMRENAPPGLIGGPGGGIYPGR